jgi:hypothetical protein
MYISALVCVDVIILNTFKVKKKQSKAVPLHAMVALGGRGVSLLLILDLCTRWG